MTKYILYKSPEGNNYYAKIRYETIFSSLLKSIGFKFKSRFRWTVLTGDDGRIYFSRDLFTIKEKALAKYEELANRNLLKWRPINEC